MRIRRALTVICAVCLLIFVLIFYDSVSLKFKCRITHKVKYGSSHTTTSSSTSVLLDRQHEKLIETFRFSDGAGNRSATITGEPPNKRISFEESSCPIQKDAIPKTDIQTLLMYNRMRIEDVVIREQQNFIITYKEDQWNPQNKLKVFIVPHSHNDPGWLKTFKNYYVSKTRAILSYMVEKLTDGNGRKFIWAEISFLALWWTYHASNYEKASFLKLIKNKRIEIVTGGWVMNDEATTHWISTVIQLTTGHQWCINNLGISPKNAWSIDPFGYSSSQPYLLKLAGLDNSIIQRVHYSVKRELALKKQLEFKWRQLWDGVGKTDVFTHVFPFKFYGVPHSCGPDYEICCQFDFRKQLCEFHPPQKITQSNIQERAFLILDQWRKKAQLYQSNIVLMPLGEDFAYSNSDEWDNQFQNYDMLIDYINGNAELNAEVQYGNLEDYFNALHTAMNVSDFPVLSGDFFPYADVSHDYWTGYFTSRPFYKSMERVLLAYVRAAETISSQAITSFCLPHVTSLKLSKRVEEARRTLALFQHHDAITGTSRDAVVEDYGRKLLGAIQNSQSVIQQAAYYLLKQPPISDKVKGNIYFNVDDNWRRHDEIPSKITINLDVLSPSRKIVLYNALTFTRFEVLSVFVSSPYVEVFDPEGHPVMIQISPVVVADKGIMFAANKYQLSFIVTVNSLALTIYTVTLRDSASNNTYTTYSTVSVYNGASCAVKLPKIFSVKNPSNRLTEDIIIQMENGTKIVATMSGLIKAMVTVDGEVIPLRMEFVQYSSQRGAQNSGAYLFIPEGPALPFIPKPFPKIIAIKGIFKTSLYTFLSSTDVADVLLAITVYNNPFLQQNEVEISNTLLIDPQVINLEFAMRFSTDIKNGDVFYTDVNGMQMTKRRYLRKVQIQGNYYPLPAAAYLQDDRHRFTLLTSTPLGVASLRSGQIEVMQDRRLISDDSRGLGQGIRDNVKTRHTFKIIIEKAIAPCSTPVDEPSGQLTLGAHVSQQLLLQPLTVMFYTAPDNTSCRGYSRVTMNAADIVLAAYRSQVTTESKDGAVLQGIGLTFHRMHLEVCYGNKEISRWYQLSNGQVQITELVDAPALSVYESTLTFVKLKKHLPNGTVTLCPHEVRSVFLNSTLKHIVI